MRYAAIDIGTNSCRLLIAEPGEDQQLITLHQEMETTRIGESFDRAGLLQEQAIIRTLACLVRFGVSMREWEVDQYRAIATSAVRESGNRAEFVARAELESGIQVEVVSGEEEARLSYAGVIRGLALSAPPLVVDLGGGSTEFICPAESILLSIPLGAVRAAEADLLASAIIEQLNQVICLKEKLARHPLVMVGGTASTLVAVKKGLIDYRPELVHGARLTRTEIGDLYDLLDSLPLELRRRLPGLQPERADIIHKGALIILMIMEVLGKNEIVVSESDTLQGIVWSLAEPSPLFSARGALIT